MDIENYYEDKYDKRFQDESIKFTSFLKDNRIRLINTISMYYKFQKSIQLFDEYRNKNNHHYDVVIKTRPDCYLSKNININKSNILYSDYGRGICGGGTGDIFIMSDQENLLKFSDIYNSLYQISESIDFFCPHRIIEKFIKQKNIIHNEISGFTLHNSKNGQWRE